MMEKPSCVIMVMVDHAPGEALGAAIADLLKLGAHGIQAVPSVTKKNRAGALLFIEPGGAESKVAEYLARELKAGGYQRFTTTHVFQEIRFIRKRVTVKAGGAEEVFDILVKSAGPENSPLFHSVEAEDAGRISEVFKEKHGVEIPFFHVKSRLESVAGNDGDALALEL